LTVWYNPFLAMLARCGGVDEKIVTLQSYCTDNF